MTVREYKTLVEVPKNHPAYAAGCTHVHLVLLQSKLDRGGFRDTVALNIPEALHQFDEAMWMAKLFKARVGFFCDTAEQAHEMATRAAVALPDHERISLERGVEGAWGLMQ